MSRRIAGRHPAAILVSIAWALLDTGAGGASEDRYALIPGVLKTADVGVRRSYWLPGNRVLALVVPEAWTQSQNSAQNDAPLTITFGPPAGRAFQVLVR